MKIISPYNNQLTDIYAQKLYYIGAKLHRTFSFKIYMYNIPITVLPIHIAEFVGLYFILLRSTIYTE